MIVVVIAGGSGTRLWPLSTPNYPKQFLRLTNKNSLLQNTLSRVSSFTQPDHIFVVSEISHVEHVYEQLPHVPKENVLIEPGRRGTASCVLLIMNEIKKRNLPSQAIFFSWADHIVADTNSFTDAIKTASSVAEQTKRMVFVGVKPTYASTGFGYLHKGQPVEGAQATFALEQFVEKPDQATAKTYVESGEYLWNTGYIVATLDSLERTIHTSAPHLWIEYQALQASKDVDHTYLDFENQPIDTALSEKIQDGLVVSGNFDWSDIGSFEDLYSAAEPDSSNNVVWGDTIETEQVHDSYIRNDLDVPIAVIGLDNVVVVATENGLLVANKAAAQWVGEVSKRIEAKKQHN